MSMLRGETPFRKSGLRRCKMANRSNGGRQSHFRKVHPSINASRTIRTRDLPPYPSHPTPPHPIRSFRPSFTPLPIPFQLLPPPPASSLPPFLSIPSHPFHPFPSFHSLSFDSLPPHPIHIMGSGVEIIAAS